MTFVFAFFGKSFDTDLLELDFIERELFDENTEFYGVLVDESSKEDDILE